MRTYVNELRLFSRDARLYLVAATIFSFALAIPTVYSALYFDALGFDRTFVGLTTTAILVGGAVLIPPAMWVLDRLGRQRAMLWGLGLNWALWGAAMFATRGELILALLVLSGFGNVLYGFTVVPLLAEASTPRERTTLFAAYAAVITLALFFGSLAAGGVPALVAVAMGLEPGSAEVYRVTLLSSLVIRVIGIWPLLRMSNQPVLPDHEVGALGTTTQHRRAGVLQFLNPRNLVKLRTPIALLSIPYALIFFASALVVPFVPLFLRSDYAASDADISVTTGASNLFIGIASAIVPVMVGRFGRVWVVAGGCALAAIFALGMVAVGPNALWLVAVFIVLRAGVANAIVPVYRAFTIDRAPVAEYTIVSLLLQLSANIGPAIAPPLSGIAQQSAGFVPVVVVCAALFFVSALLFAWVMKRAKTSGQPLEENA